MRAIDCILFLGPAFWLGSCSPFHCEDVSYDTADTGLYPRVEQSYVVSDASNPDWVGATIDLTFEEMRIRYERDGVDQLVVYTLDHQK